MKNAAKQLTSLLMAMGMVCSLIAVPASAADGSAPARTPITITVEDEVRRYKQDNPSAWSYSITEGALLGNDSIRDLVSGSPACSAGAESRVGEYPITLTPRRGASGYDVTIVNGTLTVEPAVVTSFSPDEPYAAGYYITIYASDYHNKSAESLTSLVAERKGTYKASYGQSTVYLNAHWSADGDNAAFAPKGSEKTEWGYVWYSYTAGLTAKNSSDAKNYEISLDSPRAYLRVIPVNAVQTLTPESAVLTADAAGALTDEAGMKRALGLPQTAAVTYIPDEAPEQYNGTANGEYAISGWRLEDGRALTLEALQAMAAGVAAGQELEVALTPVYAAAGDKAVPGWATLEEAPRFTLIITGKTPAAAAVKAPGSITYGGTLRDPAVEPETDSGTVTYRYVGVDGTKYDSTDKPTAAGSYRVTATLTSATHTGRWTSETFTIHPKTVTVAGITGTSREYDGSTSANAALDTGSAVITGMVRGDDLHVSAGGYFTDKNAGKDKTVVLINLALTGEDAGNYVLAAHGSQARTTASITPKPLEIDDSGIVVTKVYDGTKSAGTLEGRLALRGVIDNEVELSGGRVYVGSYADPDAGGNKTVTLSGIRLAGLGPAVSNYSLASTHTFTEAEITAKPRPALNTDFTVTIPRATYDAQPHAATVAAKNGVTGLGTASVTYARQRDDGTYDAPATGAPVDAGTYKVLVSFEEGANFAARKGRNVVEAGLLTIKKANAAAAMTIVVPVTATERTVRLSALDLPAHMARGVKLREVPSASGEVLAGVTGETGGTFFTLRTRTVGEDKTQDFELILRSDNYVKLTVTVTVTATAASLEITPPAVTVKKAVSEYGTPWEDIIAMEGGLATLNGVRIPGTFTLPDRPYDAGKYTDIEILFNSSDGNYQNLPIKVNAAFTIKKATVTSLSADEMPAYYITIYANDSANTSAEGLRNLVAERTGTYTACYGSGTVVLKPSWKAVSTARPYQFSPKGKQGNIWYSYTASLSMEQDSDGKNFTISRSISKPKAHVRVIPVNAVQSLGKDSETLPAAAIMALGNEAEMRAALGLPEAAGVTYRPAEEFQWPEFEEAAGEYAISGWRMDGKPLTLKALQAKAAGAARRDVTVTLTPVYANNAVPAWATLMKAPVFTLTITSKSPVYETGNEPACAGSTGGDALVPDTPEQAAKSIDMAAGLPAFAAACFSSAEQQGRPR